ncbi:MAG: class IV adenylate cyclase [Candidatus Aminicenantes bacterium]|nr:MAG: class IV adenylate cyclase [Candidatus Aminicenantes bacterium]
MIEIEVKIRIDDPEKMADKLGTLGAELSKGRHWEENTLYDFPSRSLFSQKRALRLRIENKKAYLTFKGPPQKSRKFKIREEYETEVKNEKQMKKILKELGFIPTFHYKKYRTTYRLKKCKICLDETSIGNYLELEGEQSQIVRVATSLGFLKKEFIKLDYVQLIKNEGGS